MPADQCYFAYGSNLDIERKEARTGTIRKAIRSRLPNYRFAFNKRAQGAGVYANILPCFGAEVWGVTYLCDEKAIGELDRYEGVALGHYVHVSVSVITEAEGKIEALTYVAGKQFVCEEGIPSQDYLKHILSGARTHQLPDRYIKEIISLSQQKNLSL